MKIIPLQNIKEIEVKDNKLFIIYQDGSKMTMPADNVKFDINYKNNNNSPEIDHCI